MSDIVYVPHRRNPYVLTLIVIGAIIVVIGLILLFVGVGFATSVGSLGASSDTGAGELALGGALTGLGGLLLVSGVIVGGVDWAISNRSRPTYVER